MIKSDSTHISVLLSSCYLKFSYFKHIHIVFYFLRSGGSVLIMEIKLSKLPDLDDLNTGFK